MCRARPPGYCRQLEIFCEMLLCGRICRAWKMAPRMWRVCGLSRGRSPIRFRPGNDFWEQWYVKKLYEGYENRGNEADVGKRIRQVRSDRSARRLYIRRDDRMRDDE